MCSGLREVRGQDLQRIGPAVGTQLIRRLPVLVDPFGHQPYRRGLTLAATAASTVTIFNPSDPQTLNACPLEVGNNSNSSGNVRLSAKQLGRAFGDGVDGGVDIR